MEITIVIATKKDSDEIELNKKIEITIVIATK